jgi:hypothetical protein
VSTTLKLRNGVMKNSQRIYKENPSKVSFESLLQKDIHRKAALRSLLSKSTSKVSFKSLLQKFASKV